MQNLTLTLLEESFPKTERYPRMWASQREALRLISENNSVTIESPTGTGKTAVEYSTLKAAMMKKMQPLFLISHNKTSVGQTKKEFPELKIALGRNEHPCFYYSGKLPPDKQPKADAIPCSLLTDCPHRVDQETGKTHTAGADPCPYLQQKFEAKQGGIVLCTMSFYLFTRLFSKEWREPEVLVIDEAHRIAEVVRGALSYELTDYHLRQSVELLREIGVEEADLLEAFYKKMIHIIKSKPAHHKTMLTAREITVLMSALEAIDQSTLLRKLEKAVREKKIDVVEKREVLKRLEVLVKDLRRYFHSFEYSLPSGDRHALNYTYAFYKAEKGEGERVQYRLVVKCYYVAPLIKKILGKSTVAFSATIGDPKIFGYETGIENPVFSLDSDFPVENTRIFLPTDTPDLSYGRRNRREPTKTLRRIAKACRRFANAGFRSIIVVSSNVQRDKFMMLAEEEKVRAISYGNGVTAKEAAVRFRDGEGEVLCGTGANYSEGVDLANQVAPVTFCLSPGFSNPDEPAAQFEMARFGKGGYRARESWRAMNRALQVRGRNIRSKHARGVTFFISQQFRRFVRASLPPWLAKAYVGDKTFDECVEVTEKLLQEK